MSNARALWREKAQLWAFFALIVFAPLPLGGNRPWALALLGLFTGSLLLLNIWLGGGCQNILRERLLRVPLIASLLWILLLAIQLVPLPIAWVEVLGRREFYGPIRHGGEFIPISIDVYSTRLYLAKACILSAVFWLVIVLVNSRRRLKWLARIIVFSGLLQAVVGIFLMATGTTFSMFFVEMSNPRGHGTFVSPNNFAGYLELTLAVGIGYMIAKLDGHAVSNWRERLHGWLTVLISEKALLRLSLIIMVVGLVASRSRMGNAAFFASLLIVGTLAIFLIRQAAKNVQGGREKNTLQVMMVFIASLVVLDVFIIGGVVGVEKVVQRIENTNIALLNNQQAGNASGRIHLQEQSLEERGEVAEVSLRLIRDFPWMGTGGGTFHLAFMHYQPLEMKGYFDHPHNDFIEFLSETGVVGGLLLLAILLHSIKCSVLQLIRSHDQYARGMAFASLMGVISLLIHGAVDFNFQILATSILFMVVVSLPYLSILLKR
ncbi:MAG: O-antigen ligase family protein [Gallionella sp.]|nr:O-antigen ligase family protein [Gallionella sp.]MDD4946749.1 O-antigen ligase family protein [Gallionella sp.]